MPNYVIPDVVRKFSGIKVDLWHWLEKNIGNQDGSFEINQSELAQKLDVSRTSIINALKTFVSANLLEKCSSGRGRGNHCKYKLLWTFRERNGGGRSVKCNPLHACNSNPQEKDLTKAGDLLNTSKTFIKGTKAYRYYAMKFRRAVEGSTLAKHSQKMVSVLIEYLKGKPVQIARTWLIYLRNWLDERHQYLGEFFNYFRDTLKKLARERLDSIRRRGQLEQKRKERREIKAEYQENPPPRSEDFGSFSNYLQAMESWEGC